MYGGAGEVSGERGGLSLIDPTQPVNMYVYFTWLHARLIVEIMLNSIKPDGGPFRKFFIYFYACCV